MIIKKLTLWLHLFNLTTPLNGEKVLSWMKQSEQAKRANVVSEKGEKQDIHFLPNSYMVQGWFFCVSVRLCIYPMRRN